MSNRKFRVVVLVAVVVSFVAAAWASPTAFAQTPPEPQSPDPGAFYIGEDGAKRLMSVGDVVIQTQRLADGACGPHDFTVGGRGDVKSITLDFDQSRCAMVVAEIVRDSRALELEALIQAEADQPGGATQSATEAKWRVQAVGEWRGAFNEELTQVKATVEFKTSSLTGGGPLFDRYVAPPDCWGNYNPPWFDWTEDSCTSLGSASGPGLMSSTISGTFHHAVLRWMHHEIRSKVRADGWESIPAAFDWDCRSIGHVSWPASFHCEEGWKLISWP